MRDLEVDNLKWEKMDGLIPAIIQNSETLQPLMLGYMNQDALKKTIKTGLITFYSRSKERLWVKGETSGNKLHLEDIVADCDADALWITARPDGPTCHRGTTSCFGEDTAPGLGFLAYLSKVIDQRITEQPEGSYTTKLFRKGLDKIAQKVGEEAVEVVIASKNESKEQFIDEVSDLIYHLVVLLRAKGVSLFEVIHALRKRNST